MKHFLTVSITAVALLLSAGCDKGERSTSRQADTTQASTRPEAVARTGSGHGAKDAVPGSYEDWCEEHQVPESLDTRCDPALAAAFKASGDWCDEHGLPESQCLKCNPDLKIVRPPKAK